MKNFDWDDAWQMLLMLACIGIACFIIRLGIVDRPIQGYYIDSSREGRYEIKIDIDNYVDDNLTLERAISLDSAISYVQRLNSTLKNK